MTFSILPYRLPLVQPWLSARSERYDREGWIVRLERDGFTGFGDCAPLPEAGTESFEDAAIALSGPLDDLDRLPPAVRCAVETAVLDIEAQQRGLSLAKHLNPNAANSALVNASAGALYDAILPNGFDVVKIKVGIGPVQTELALLKDFASRLDGGISLRLDANGAWSFDQALEFLSGLDGLPIEHVEEPLYNPDLSTLIRLKEQTPIRLALDESLAAFPLHEVLAAAPVDVLVLKPMVLGGPKVALEISTKTAMTCIVTTTIDSAVGCAMAAHLAAAIDPNSQWHHGLATSTWLANDVANPLSVVAGTINLPATVGLGISLSEAS